MYNTIVYLFRSLEIYEMFTIISFIQVNIIPMMHTFDISCVLYSMINDSVFVL